MMSVLRILFLVSASVCLAAAVACGGSIATSGGGSSCTPATLSSAPASCPVRTPVAGVAFSGKVLADLEPVSGASIELYAAGIAGNGSAPAALLTSPAVTAADGSFAISAGYTCPSAQTPVYLVAKGGQPGAGAANSSVWLMTALGPCGSINVGSSFVLNEVTTAAAVWALAPFMSSGGDVGASCTNTTGLNNAFLTASSLANSATGSSPGAGNPTTIAVPTTKLNSLANALASCTGSNGGSGCSALFSATTSGSSVPTNTLDAALNIAHAPANNAAQIYALASGSAAFSPALAAVPADWMMHSTISGGGMASPASVGVTASGDVWVSSYFGAVSEFTPGGGTAFPSGITGDGINQSYGMALDPEGNVWVANEQTDPNAGSGNIAELNSSGAAIIAGITSGGIDFPKAVAADSDGDVWVADYANSKVSLFSSSGAALSPSTGWGGSSLAFPVALAIDANHNAWVANQGGNLPVTEISPDGSQVTNFNCDCDEASGIATDQSGNVWLANYYGNSISEVNTCGTLILDAETGGGVDHPQAIAVDGGGNVWVSNYLGNSISEIDGASSAEPGTFTSPPAGFGADASLLQPYGLAIDPSGNLWVSNFGNDTLTQLIGVAVPVKTPLAGPPRQP